MDNIIESWASQIIASASWNPERLRDHPVRNQLMFTNGIIPTLKAVSLASEILCRRGFKFETYVDGSGQVPILNYQIYI